MGTPSTPLRPARTPSPPSRSATRATPLSPPGFPCTPQYKVSSSPQQYHNSPHLPVSLYDDDHGQMSPTTANITMLGSMFNNADVAPDVLTERCALFECDTNGDIEVDDAGNNTYYLTEG